MDFITISTLCLLSQNWGTRGADDKEEGKDCHQNRGSLGTADFLKGPSPTARPGTRNPLTGPQGCVWKGKWSPFH